MSSSKKNYSKEPRVSKIASPAVTYPELILLLAMIAYHVQELHKLTTLASLGNAVDLHPQAIDYHVKKIRKTEKK